MERGELFNLAENLVELWPRDAKAVLDEIGGHPPAIAAALAAAVASNLDELFQEGAKFRSALTDRALAEPLVDEDDDPDKCTNPGGHEWAYTGTQYGGDDDRWHGEGRCYCIHCGADGDA